MRIAGFLRVESRTTNCLAITMKLNLNSKSFNQRVHENYAWMRVEQPVYHAKISWFSSAYLITRYEDVNALLLDNDRLMKNPRAAKSDDGRSSAMWLPPAFRPLMNNMLNTDEPDHRRLRNLVHKAFTPRMIAELEPRIQEIADRLLVDAQRGGDVDIVSQFALPLPVTVIAEMIGIPEEDRGMFRRISERIVVTPTPLNLMRATFAIRSFVKYIRKLAKQRRREPKEDLLSALSVAEHEGESLSEDELIGMVFLLLVAGHETTVGLIGNGTLALLNHPEQLEQLRSNIAAMDLAVEEMLRYDGPLQTTEQAFARKSFVLHGVSIPKGATLLPAIISANRDEEVFEDANEFLVDRSPNKHLAFGKGIHYCLGAPLARLEAKIAFTALLNVAPKLRFVDPQAKPEYNKVMFLNRVRQLLVRFT